MSIRSMRCTMLLALLAGLTLPLAAQTLSTGQSGTDNNTNFVEASPSGSGAAAPVQSSDSDAPAPAKVEVFLGYSWINSNSTINGLKNDVPVSLKLKDAKGGFVVDFSYFFNKWFGLTFDSGAHFGNNYDYDEVVIGPTVRFPGEHLQPFIHGMGGWTRLSPGDQNQNDVFGLIGGGGLDLHVNQHFGLRLIEADYIYAQHNYGNGNPTYVDNVRISTGLMFYAGGKGEEALPPSATCSVDKAEIWAGEPVKATVAARNFNPKHTLKYDWTTNGGKVEGVGDTVTVNTTGIPEGQSFNVSVQVSDPKGKNVATSCQASFATRRRLPPTITCSANPTSTVQGGAITIHCDASSPQGAPVQVAISTDCGPSSQGADLSINTASLQPGRCNATGTVTDDHQLTASSPVSFTVQPKPLPPAPPPPPPTLTLRSVYFATAQPTEKDPNAGLVKSQEDTLRGIASEFVKYVAVRPEARLTLEAHADPRGGNAYNQKLTERRAARVKAFLIQQGVPEGSLDTVALGDQHQLTPEEVREQVDNNTDLTPGERKRILANMRVIVLANNRRVDIKLSGQGVTTEESVHKYPWNAADSLSLIGGREKPAPAPKAKAPARKRTPPPARRKKTQ